MTRPRLAVSWLSPPWMRAVNRVSVEIDLGYGIRTLPSNNSRALWWYFSSKNPYTPCDTSLSGVRRLLVSGADSLRPVSPRYA